MSQAGAGGATVLAEPDTPRSHAVALTIDGGSHFFVEEEDSIASPIGVQGLDEIGIVGVAAAVASAVAHATGRRIRNLPITPDEVIG